MEIWKYPLIVSEKKKKRRKKCNLFSLFFSDETIESPITKTLIEDDFLVEK